MKILVVEDDMALASACVRVLASVGHEARYAVSLGGAQYAISDMNPDVVILDLKLDDCREPCHVMSMVRTWVDEQTVPIVVFSAHPLNHEQCIEGGCSEFLLKGDFTPMDLPAAIERAVNRHKLVAALNRREAMQNGDMTWPGGNVEPDKVGDRMISLAQELRAAAAAA